MWFVGHVLSPFIGGGKSRPGGQTPTLSCTQGLYTLVAKHKILD
jgi:hypothetical protein